MHPTTEMAIAAGLRRINRSTANFIVGVDEVGYGAWSGPVVVCAAVVPAFFKDKRVRDSKKIAPAARERLANRLLVPPVVVAECLLENSNEVIDRIGLVRARDLLVVEAVTACLAAYPGSLVVMDGNVLPPGLGNNAVCFPKADDLVPAVSAASIIAKTYRDSLMQSMHAKYPVYGFDTGMGYGTAAHAAALRKYGACPIHRMSYRNIKQLVAGRG